MPTKTNHTSLQGVPQNTKEESTPIENNINRLNIKDVQICNVASNWRVQYMSSDYIRKNIVVCNGGDTTSDVITNTLAVNRVHYL